MNELIERCIAEIREKSENNNAERCGAQAPENPSIIVNYNLDHKTLENYCKFLERLWPNVYTNVPQTDTDSDFAAIENQVRSNQLYYTLNQIQIHILVNITKCSFQELNNFLDEKFNGPTYAIILHEFLDCETEDKIKESKNNLLTLMKNSEKINYQFIYSNRLSNGAMWLDENASKLIRLAANITAIMSIDSRYFNDSDVYTFSYNLLEKPTRKIVQFTIRRLLEDVCKCSDDSKLDQDILRRYKGIIQHEAAYKMSRLEFKENDFKYLPDNKMLQKEKANVKKGIFSLERNFPVAAMCFKAMIRRKISENSSVIMQSVDFSEELSDPLITFYTIEGFLKRNPQKEALLESMKRALFHDKQISDEGSYSKVLTEYANKEIEQEIIETVFEDFSKQFMERVEHSCNVYEWLLEYLHSAELQISALESEENLIDYYSGQVDDYFARHRDNIIAELNSCTDKEESLKGKLYSILLQIFNNIPVYYKSFEDEIDERVGKNTAKSIFERISNEDNIERNICIDWSDLQFYLNKVKTSNVLLLINPNSKLLNLNITGNYESLKLGRQDCVERIDFHALSLRTGVK